MTCHNCKHLRYANGGSWCAKGQAINFINDYPCSFREPLVASITTTSDGTSICQEFKDTIMKASEELGENVGRLAGEAICAALVNEHDCIVKASRLAESVLMERDKNEQIELAKDVAVMAHNILFKEDAK